MYIQDKLISSHFITESSNERNSEILASYTLLVDISEKKARTSGLELTSPSEHSVINYQNSKKHITMLTEGVIFSAFQPVR